MQNKQPEVTEDEIICCPTCDVNLFTPVYVYACPIITSPIIAGQKPNLVQVLAAFKCVECGTLIPYAEFRDFTKQGLKLLREKEKQNYGQQKNEQEFNSTEVQSH